MLKAAILHNIQTRPDVFGSKFHMPLTGSHAPLPTLPPIVGNTGYKVAGSKDLDRHYAARFGNSYIAGGDESPATQFIRKRLAGSRNMISEAVTGLKEPSLNNPRPS